MKFSVKELIKITHARIINSSDEPLVFSVCTDSRTITEDDVYLPLAGEKFDGHDFIESVVEKGVRAYFIDKNHFSANYPKVDFVFGVNDTLCSYLQLAEYHRDKVNPIVVAVTGSSGKTTVKEMLTCVLSQKYKTHKSKLNHNNEIGLCQTLLSMPEDTEFLVVEMGMRGLGEIELLSKYAKPDIAIINNIGTAHIGRLGNVESIAKAKCEITQYLHPEGCLIAYNDDLIKKYSKTENIVFFDESLYKVLKMDESGVEFLYKNNNLYKLNASGEYNVLNAIAVIEAAKKAGLSYEIIYKGLLEYVPIEKRGSKIELKKGSTLINDCYNANPESMKASIKAFTQAYKEKKKALVIGDMGELGYFQKKYHREVGSFLKEQSVDYLITVGELSKIIASESMIKNSKSFMPDEIQEISDYVKSILDEDLVVLFKASRSMKLETIIEKLLEE